MQSQDTRLASFQSILKPKSKAKQTWPLSPSTHPHLTPQRLAKAGFFHTPGKDVDSQDVVTCFLCQLVLGGWDEEDDPDVEHVKRGGCAWARLVCGLNKDRTIYENEQDLPSSSQSQASRIATYGKWWPHKMKAGWLPTVSNLARAGFIYAPSSNSTDAVTCPYCNYAVEGWEATDDPWEIHHSKVPQCPFFNSTLAKNKPEPVKKARTTKSTAASSTASRRTKRTPALAESEAEPEAQPPVAEAVAAAQEPESNPVAEASTSKSSRRTTKASSQRSASARSKSRVTETEDEEAKEEAVEPVSKRSAASSSRRAAAVKSDAEGTVDEEPVSARSMKSKGKNKAVTPTASVEVQASAEQAIEPEGEVAPKAKPKVKAKAPKAKAAPKGKKGKGKAKEPDVTVDTVVAEIETEAEAAMEASEVELVSETDEPASEVESLADPLPELLADQPTPKANHAPSSTHAHASPAPPPVPSKDTPRARPIRPLSSATKPRASPRTALPRPMLDKSVEEGAVAARQAMVDLLSPKVTGPAGSAALDEPLPSEQEDMTVEELVRHEMAMRYQELERQGEESIAKWLERTRGARERIETV